MKVFSDKTSATGDSVGESLSLLIKPVMPATAFEEALGFDVGVFVGVVVFVGVGDFVGVGVFVGVRVLVGVNVTVGMGVGVGPLTAIFTSFDQVADPQLEVYLPTLKKYSPPPL